MRLFARRKRLLALSILLILLGLLFIKLSQYEIVRSYLVRYSYLDHLGPDLHVDPQMPESQKQDLLASVVEAKNQIAALYGEYSAKPVVIAGHTMEIMKRYGGNSYNRAGRTYITLLGSTIILGPEGVCEVDIISHEFAHAELAARVGYRNLNKIPNWFDEGLAVQFDSRIPDLDWPDGSDEENTELDLGQTGTIQHDDRRSYTEAKREVGRWLRIVGNDGLQALLAAVKSGEDFQESYHSIESGSTADR